MKLIKSTKLFALSSAAAVLSLGATAFAGEVVADGKATKEVKVEEKKESPWSFNFTAAYDSSYMFRGVNLLDLATDGGNLLSADVNVSAYGFTLGAWYAQSINEGDDDEDYNELDLYLSYTHSLGPVDLTGGYIFYLYPKTNLSIPESNYYTQEFFVGISTSVIPFVTPSLNFYYDFDKYDGGYLEFKLSSSIPVIGEIVSIDPYALISYDFEYNSDSSDWNNFQAGITVPIHVTPNITISGYAAVSVPLEALDWLDDDYEVWGGAKVGFSF